MDENYPHLRISRKEPVNERRSKLPLIFSVPEDPAAHARILRGFLEHAKERTDEDIGGFDDRRLFRFEVQSVFNPGGITKSVNWKGGGGFRYYRRAPSLLEKDPWGNWVIREKYDSAMLAEALCKHEGFTYAPSDTLYWQHGHSTERDYIYVTTQTLSRAQLEALSEEVGDERTLLICCGAFRVKRDAFANLTLKKIPNAVLNRCEFGRDDYSLAVAGLPDAPVKPGTQTTLLGEDT